MIDLAAGARLEKEIGKADGDIKRVDQAYQRKFVANAPEEIVEEEKRSARQRWREVKLQEALGG